MRPLRVRGFTLVEVLVVMLIIGVTLSGLSLGMDAMRGQDEARAVARLRHVLEASGERASLRGQVLAFELLADGYRFSTLRADGRWVAFDEPPFFAEKMLPEGLRWTGLQQGALESGRIVFGHRMPRFELALRGEGGTHRLRSLPSGRVEVLSGAEAGL